MSHFACDLEKSRGISISVVLVTSIDYTASSKGCIIFLVFLAMKDLK